MNGAHTTTTLYACVHAGEFPAQALLRLRPDLQSEPVAVLEGLAPVEAVCFLNRAAKLKGAVLGMTRLEAEGLAGLRLLSRSLEGEAAARAVLLECAANFSPRIEAAHHGAACAFVLDVAGTERLFGPPAVLAQRLRAALASAGYRVSIAISSNFHAARLKAASAHGITVMACGQEALAMAKLPVALLGLETEYAETFALWGIRTLGELAALPEDDLVARLGARAKHWRDLAGGAAAHPFEPMEAEFCLKEFFVFETPVEQADALLFVLARMIDCLVARAVPRALSLASLTVELELAGGYAYQRVIRPALPSADRKFLLKLVQLEIAAHPPQAAIRCCTLTAEAGQSSRMQLGLFAPQMPEPCRLDVTLARLKAMVGEDRAGSPVLDDTHRPGSFRMRDFTVSAVGEAAQAPHPRIALRRIRPPVPVRVALRAMKPISFRNGRQTFVVEAAYGPWRTSGCWWSTDGWDAEEWDVLAQPATGSPVACLLVQDRVQNRWRLEAYYD